MGRPGRRESSVVLTALAAVGTARANEGAGGATCGLCRCCCLVQAFTKALRRGDGSMAVWCGGAFSKDGFELQIWLVLDISACR